MKKLKVRIWGMTIEATDIHPVLISICLLGLVGWASARLYFGV